MKKFEKLNAYLSNLAVLNIKLHNLHWNVTGYSFVQIHEFTESQYDDMFAKYDDVAELIKIKGEMPLVKMADYLQNATVQELDGKNFTSKEVIDIVEADYKLLVAQVEELRSIGDQENDYALVAMMEDHAEGYNKNLWFIRQMKA